MKLNVAFLFLQYFDIYICIYIYYIYIYIIYEYYIYIYIIYIIVIMKTMCPPVIMATHTLGLMTWNTHEPYIMCISARVVTKPL